jgi:hypothetical protein
MEIIPLESIRQYNELNEKYKVSAMDKVNRCSDVMPIRTFTYLDEVKGREYAICGRMDPIVWPLGNIAFFCSTGSSNAGREFAQGTFF